MRNANWIGCCIAVALSLAGVAIGHGAEGTPAPRVVAPEPAVPESLAESSARDAGVLAGEAAPVPEDASRWPQDGPPIPAPLVSSAHSPAGCPPPRVGCPGGVCGGGWRCFRARMKACLQASHWGYPEEFCELPLGARLYAHLNAQVANGVAAQMVLYRYDFCDGILHEASQLNHHGRTRLQRMGWMLRCNLHPLIVEETPEEPSLAAARREHVIQSLAASGIAVPDEWVVVGQPPSAGLSGEEAIIVYHKMVPPEGQAPTPSPSGGGPGIGALQILGGGATQSQSMSPSGGRTGGR
jgi:hypothetical protein